MLLDNPSPEALLLWGTLAHLIVDWLFQNEWQAVNKVSLRHPAAYVHSGLHFAGMALVFPLGAAAAIAFSHLLIDTRVPNRWWSNLIRQRQEGEMGLHIVIWTDQVTHIGAVALAAVVVG